MFALGVVDKYELEDVQHRLYEELVLELVVVCTQAFLVCKWVLVCRLVLVGHKKVLLPCKLASWEPCILVLVDHKMVSWLTWVPHTLVDLAFWAHCK